jgi:putative ATPase
VESAKREQELYDRRTILFVDEVHRWNKAQQDALLPYVENGTIILIGATTENPFFEVNKALVSRSRVFQLQSLSDDDLMQAARAAIADKDRGYGKWRVDFDEGALEHLVKVAAGDARSLLNALELAVETSAEPWPPVAGSMIRVTMEAAEESIQKRAVLYDRDGDYHYDAASAFIKSVRGSDPDATLYWLARMVYAGEDPRFIFRRLLISAAEDVGLADPGAIGIVESCAASYERIGLPEGQFHLALAALYLATAPKSNSCLAYFDALAAVESERAEVPDHLKDANRDAEGLGHGAGYLYPHAFRTHWTSQQYMPSSLKGAMFYQPGVLGYEANVRDDVLRRRDAVLAAWLSGELDARTTNPAKTVSWTDRAEAGAATGLAGLRDVLFKAAFPKRHANVLVLYADDGLLLREAVRVCPEGSVCGLCANQSSLDRLAYAFSDMEEIYRPHTASYSDPSQAAAIAVEAAGHSNFDLVMASGFFSSVADPQTAVEALQACAKILRTNPQERNASAGFAIAERAPTPGILPALAKPFLEDSLSSAFIDADRLFFSSASAPGYPLDKLVDCIKKAGLYPESQFEYRSESRRVLGDREAILWTTAESSYGTAIIKHLGDDAAEHVQTALRKSFSGDPVVWPSVWSICLANTVVKSDI